MSSCRASELSKERNKAIEATSEIVHQVNSGNKRDHGAENDKDGHRKLIRKCKFCGRLQAGPGFKQTTQSALSFISLLQARRTPLIKYQQPKGKV